MLSEFSETNVIQNLCNLMNNERIHPEPQFECFSKYLATMNSNEVILKNEKILNLINSHGIHLQNEVKYWLDRGLEEEYRNEEFKPGVPVLDPKNFVFQDFDDVITKLKELPSEWTILQITKKFSIYDMMRKVNKEAAPAIHITRFSCGKEAERIHPYCVTVDQSSNSVENIFQILKDLAKLRRVYFSMGRRSKKLYDAYYNTNSELMKFIKELESYILKHWICLFHGKLVDSILEKKTLAQLRKLINSFSKKENIKLLPNAIHENIIYQVALSAHFLKNRDIFTVLKLALYGSENDSLNAAELMLLVEDIKMLNLSKGCEIKRAKYNPVILILDKEFENVPWEMIAPLIGQPVCRISSLQLLYALYKYHQPYIQNGLRSIEVDCVYGLINPGKDLESCEKQMKEFLKKRLPWAEVEIGVIPDPKDLIKKIQDYTTYLYCGHGSGMQYLRARDLKNAFVRGLILLFGCSSNVPRNCGGRTPHQNNTYTYITNGCPCIIGCMQDVSSSDADAACKEMLTKFMPYVEFDGGEAIVRDPLEPNVLEALAAAKGVCTKYWSQSALVARGIPCKITVGDRTKIISKFSS